MVSALSMFCIGIYKTLLSIHSVFLKLLKTKPVLYNTDETLLQMSLYLVFKVFFCLTELINKSR